MTISPIAPSQPPILLSVDAQPPVSEQLPPPLKNPNLEVVSPVETHAEKAARHKTALTAHLSAFTALSLMRDWAGVDNSNKLPLLNMAHRVVTPLKPGDVPPSLWQVFVNNHPNLTLFQKLCAGLFYLLLYKTSLVSNTLEAYFEPIYKQFNDALSDDKKRDELFSKFLRESKEFIEADLDATATYAKGEGKGITLENLREAKINATPEQISELSQKLHSGFFSNKLPTVSLFKEQQEIPVIGSLFELIQWAVNKLILQKLMKSVLPYTFEASINNSMSLVAPTSLSFQLAITKFLASQLESAEKLLNQPFATPQAQTFQLRDTQKKDLEEVMKKFYELLKLEPYREAKELQKVLESENSSIDEQVHEGILKGTIDGMSMLFNYLHEAGRSQELTANILEISNNVFSGEPKTQEELSKALEEEQTKFGEKLQSVIGILVNNSISERVKGNSAILKKKKQDRDKDYKEKQELFDHFSREGIGSCDLMNQLFEKEISSETLDFSTTLQKTLQDSVQTLKTNSIFTERPKQMDVQERLNFHEPFEKLLLFTDLQEKSDALTRLISRQPYKLNLLTQLRQKTDLINDLSNQYINYQDLSNQEDEEDLDKLSLSRTSISNLELEFSLQEQRELSASPNVDGRLKCLESFQKSAEKSIEACLLDLTYQQDALKTAVQDLRKAYNQIQENSQKMLSPGQMVLPEDTSITGFFPSFWKSNKAYTNPFITKVLNLPKNIWSMVGDVLENGSPRLSSVVYYTPFVKRWISAETAEKGVRGVAGKMGETAYKLIRHDRVYKAAMMRLLKQFAT